MNIDAIREAIKLKQVKEKQNFGIHATANFFEGKRPSKKVLWSRLHTYLDSRDCANWSDGHREYLIRAVRSLIKNSTCQPVS